MIIWYFDGKKRVKKEVDWDKIIVKESQKDKSSK